MWLRNGLRLFSRHHGSVTLTCDPPRREKLDSLSKRETRALIEQLASDTRGASRPDLAALYIAINQPSLDVSRVSTRSLVDQLLLAVDREQIVALPLNLQTSGGGSRARPLPPGESQAAPSPAPGPSLPSKELTAFWTPESAFCGDEVRVCGQSRNVPNATPVVATISSADFRYTLKDTTNGVDFELPWLVEKVVFKGNAPPSTRWLDAEVSAAGLSARVPQCLAVHRVPDIELTPISFQRSSGP